jgi:hypothetical protein
MTKYAEPSSDLSDLDLPDSDDDIVAAKTKRSKMRKDMTGKPISAAGSKKKDADEEVKGDDLEST